LASWCGAIVNAETRSICQDRLGTSIGKVQKEREAFSAGTRSVSSPSPRRCMLSRSAMTGSSTSYQKGAR
jgi:hypothetical protein